MARLDADPKAKWTPAHSTHSRWGSFLSAGAAALAAGALAAILVASFITNRANDSARRDLFDRLEPYDVSLGRLDVSVLTMSSQARVYGLTGDPVLRARYDTLRIAFEENSQRLQNLAPAAGFEAESREIDGLARVYIFVADRIVAARDAGNTDEAHSIVFGDAAFRLDEYSSASFRLSNAVDVRKAGVEAHLRSLQQREEIVLILAGVAAGGAALTLVWLALRNRRLLAQIDDQRQQLDNVVSNVPGVVWEAQGNPASHGHVMRFVSHHAETMLGYSIFNWISVPEFCRTVTHPDDRDRAAQEMEAIFRGGLPGECQSRWIASDGRVLDVLTYASVVFDAEGRPAGMRGVTIDISDRKRAEEGLRISAESGRRLFESLDYSSTLAALADLCVPQLADWCAVHLCEDDGFREIAIVHRDPEKTELARDLFRRYPPRPDARRGLPHVVRTGEPEMVSHIPDEMLVRFAFDEEHLDLLRGLHLTSYICVPLVAHERVLGALTLMSAESGHHYGPDDLALAQDLALRAAIAVENVQLYSEAERERARFASIVASVPVGVYQLDERGLVVYVNPAAPGLLHISHGEILGRDPHEAIPHRLLDGSPCAAHRCVLRHAVSSHLPRTGIVSLGSREHEGRELEVTSSPVLVHGAPSGAVVVFQDITERLRQARMKDDFLAFASHELRSPLTTLSGFAKWLEKRTTASASGIDPESEEAIHAISREADRMVNIVELFLDLTRIESNQLSLDLEPVDYRHIVLDEVQAATARHPEVRIEADMPAEPVAGIADVNRLRQVLTNLLENAARYGAGQADPDVRVRLVSDGDRVRVSVWNGGPGIAPEDQPHIFERFYRGREGDARKSGIGIGLFISRQIAERMGGTLSFESSVARGTEFVLTFPLGDGLRAAVEDTGAAAPPGD